MDASHFDRLTRILTTTSSRRLFLRGLATLGLVAGSVLEETSAKKGKKKLNFNEFGCVSVGQPCKGKDALCCSGICKGKKPKKGKPDKRKCAAHNTGGCTAAQDTCGMNQPPSACLSNGVCTRTTGEANFCAKIGFGDCMECASDADCQAYGPGAACIVCDVACPQTTTACLSAAG